LTTASKNTLAGLDQVDWTALRGEMIRVLEVTERQEVRDALLADVRGSIADQFAARYTAAEKALAAEIVAPLIVPNSSYDSVATQAGATLQPPAWHRSPIRCARARSWCRPASASTM
jgi:membrane-associated HD superfamily phosphohydrolase